MATEKILNTRVQLKYDSYANWDAVKSTFKPLKGEICIVNPGTKLNDASTTPCLMKVGDGTNFFKDLQWVSAIAADVYAWAKKTEAEFTAWVKNLVPVEVIDNQTGKFITEVTVTNDENGHHFTVTRSDVQWTDVKNAPDFALKSELPTALGVMSANKATGTAITVDNTDAANPKIGFKINATQGENVTVTQSDSGLKVEVDLSSYTKDEELGVLAKKDNITHDLVTDFDTAVKAIKVNNAVLADKATADGEGRNIKNTYAEKATTLAGYAIGDAYRKTEVDNLVQGAKDYADANDENTEYHVVYDSINKKIKLVAGADASKMEIPTDDFIKDGMINTVEIDETTQELVITWNTDAGKDETRIKLSELADIYTGVDGTTITVTVSSDDKIGAEVKTGSLKDGHIAADAAIAETKLAQGVQSALALARTALQKHQDISGKKNVQTAVADQNLSGAKVIKGIAQDVQGVITVSTRDLTPGDIGAQPVGNYKTQQTAVTKTGATTKTVTKIEQNKNGEIINVEFSNIAFPEDKDTWRPIAIDHKEGTWTSTGNDGCELGLNSSGDIELDNNSGGEGYLGFGFNVKDKAITTTKIADHAVGAHQTKACKDYTGDDAEVWVFDCGSATVNV